MEVAIQAVRRCLHFAPYTPLCFTSALLGEGIDDLMSVARATYNERLQSIPPGKLAFVLRQAIVGHFPPARKGKSLAIAGVRQVDVNPPTFLFAVNDPKLVHFSYQRYLENRLRQAFGYTHTHLRLVFKKGE